MTKEQALQIIKTLSAIESWAFAQEKPLPDYLHDDLCTAMALLTKEVLK